MVETHGQGCSAGGGSTAVHMVNTRSWPYFDQAAGNSGVMSKWDVVSMRWAEVFYATLKNRSKCGDTGTVACLVNLTAAELSTAALGASAATGAFANGNAAYNFGLPYAPVIDGVELDDEPHALAAKGHWFKGPVLVGSARQEKCGQLPLSKTLDAAGFIAWANSTCLPRPLSLCTCA